MLLTKENCNLYLLVLIFSLYVLFRYGLDFGYGNVGIHNILILLGYILNFYWIFSSNKNRKIFHFSSVFILFILFFSVLSGNSILNYKTLLLSLFLFQFLFIFSFQMLEKFFNIFQYIIIANASLSIVQYFIRYFMLVDLKKDWLYPSITFFDRANPFYGSGFFTHPSTNAFFMIFGMGLIIYKLLQSKNKIYYIYFFISFLSICTTLSRTAIISSILLIIFILFFNKRVFLNLLTISFISYIGFISISSKSFTYVNKVSIINYSINLKSDKNIDNQKDSDNSRIINIKNDYRIFKELSLNEKLFGLKSSYYSYKNKFILKYQNEYNEYEKRYLLKQNTPHFLLFTMLFKYGVFLFLIGFLFIVYITIISFKSNNYKSKYFILLSYVLMLYCVTHDIFDDRLYWFVLGLSVLYERKEKVIV